MSNAVLIVLGGSEYTGWKRVTVQRSLEVLAGRFSVSLTQQQPIPLSRDTKVEVWLHENLVLSGYTDRVTASITPADYSLTISGRDRAGDLVDASAETAPQEFASITLEQLIREITDPFDISVRFEVDAPEVFQKFALQQETVFSAIERACRMRGVFVTSDEFGRLVVSDHGNARAVDALVVGENILQITSMFDDRERFSHYTVLSQRPSSDFLTAEDAISVQGKATDSNVTRYRPKIILAEGVSSPENAIERAEWEATVRAARGQKISVLVPGWLQSNGELWREGLVVFVRAPELNINQEMLIRDVSFTLDDTTGERTHFVLVPEDAYEKQPVRAKDVADGLWALNEGYRGR